MATSEQALADLKTLIAGLDLGTRTEILKRIQRELEDRKRDSQEQKVSANLSAAQNLASHNDLRLNDVKNLVQELQEAAGQPV